MDQMFGRAIVAVILVAGVAAASPAKAENAMQVCGAKYRAAKTAGTVPAGQTWNQYLAACRATLPKDAADTPAVKKVSTAKTTGDSAPKAPRTLSAAQTAERSRIKQCAAQWQSDKAANKVPAGQTWPRYWSACSARLKG